MNHKLIFALSLFVFILTAGCGEKIDSIWKSQNIVIDGKGGDWEGIPLQYHEDMNLMYGLVNDDELINLMILFNDEQLARLFSMRGFTLWLNEEDEEEKEIGIYYRDDIMRERFREQRMVRSRESKPRDQNLLGFVQPKGKFYLAKADTFTLTHIKDVPGFAAAADLNDGVYCFEFALPLTSAHKLDSGEKNKIKIGFEIVGMSEEEKEKLKTEMEERRSAMQGGSRGGQGMGGMRDGMRGGGMRGGGNRPQMPDMDGEEYWISVTLANK